MPHTGVSGTAAQSLGWDLGTPSSHPPTKLFQSAGSERWEPLRWIPYGIRADYLLLRPSQVSPQTCQRSNCHGSLLSLNSPGFPLCNCLPPQEQKWCDWRKKENVQLLPRAAAANSSPASKSHTSEDLLLQRKSPPWELRAQGDKWKDSSVLSCPVYLTATCSTLRFQFRNQPCPQSNDISICCHHN